ncbi:MAG: hypothetical protein Q7T55_13200 [Solirubrobacteraceae bacterium]|nr:hypothetical protein [Solirubrobacteraceae bacterium]
MFAPAVPPTTPSAVPPPPALVRTIGPSTTGSTALDGGAEVAAVASAFPVAALRADGLFVTLVDGASAARGLAMLSIDAWATPTSTAIRASSVQGTRGFTDVSSFAPGQAGGIDGYDWHVIERKRSASAPAATRLIALDDSGHIHLMSSLPPTAAGAQVVPTGRGMRVVTTKAPATVMTDSGREIASIRGFRVASSIGLSDGSLLLAGTRRTAGGGSSTAAPTSMRKISRSGTVSAWHPGFTVSSQQAITPLHATPRGIVYLAAQANPPSGDTPPANEPALILRTTTRHTIRVTASQLGVARSPACSAPGTTYRLVAIAGPAGAPIARLDCISGPVGAQVAQQSTLIGLSDKLQPRWVRDLTPPSLADVAVGPQGTLVSLSAEGTLSSATVSDALPTPRGSVLSVHAGEGGPPFTRLRCDHAEGRICNGIAELSAGGKVIASARYAMRARPGRAAAVVIRHFAGAPSKPRGRLSVRLRTAT